MPNLAALRATVFKLFAKNRWGHNMPPSSARVKPFSNTMSHNNYLTEPTEVVKIKHCGTKFFKKTALI